MKRIRCVLTIVLLLIGQISQAQTINEEDSFYQKLESHTVKLYRSIDGSPFSYVPVCTAVLVEKQENMSMLFTARHCVENYDGSYMVLSSKPYFVVRKYISRYSDIAVLLVNASIEDKTPVTLSSQRLLPGDQLYNFAYPGTVVFKNKGDFLDEDWYAGQAGFLVIGGCSGSGVYNKDAELVGIVSGYNKNQPVSYYIPVAEFMRLFRQMQVDGELAFIAEK